MGLSKEQILGFKAQPTSFEVPEWGGEINLVPLSVSQFDRFVEAREKGQSPGSILALLVSMSAVDDEGKPLFKSSADVTGLEIETITRIGNEALRISKLTKEDQPENPS